MAQAAYFLDSASRNALLDTLHEVCLYRDGRCGPRLCALLMCTWLSRRTCGRRSNERFKSYASRALNRCTSEGTDQEWWARHGNTRWLWKDRAVRERSA